MPAMPGMPSRARTTQTGGFRQRGPREANVGGRTAPLKPASMPPAMTQPEWAIYWALERLGLRPEVDFQYLVPVVAGRGQTGYTEVDILVYSHNIAILVNGEYFHYEQGAQNQASDRIVYTIIASQGYIPVVIDAEDANRDPIGYAQDALNGITRSRQRGLF